MTLDAKTVESSRAAESDVIRAITKSKKGLRSQPRLDYMVIICAVSTNSTLTYNYRLYCCTIIVHCTASFVIQKVQTGERARQ